MKAMVMERVTKLPEDQTPLHLADLPRPRVGARDILVRVSACGVCHTELDEIEGRTPPPAFPLVPGHEVVGRVEETGREAGRFRTGDRVGIGWIFSACGTCPYCRDGLENLCHDFRATGRDADGGYAEYMVVSEDFAHPIPEYLSDAQAAPLLCAGAIGYRSLRLTGLKDGQSLGLTGFGASAHLVMKLAAHTHPGSPVFVFARSKGEQEFARELGAVWAGDTRESCPEKLHAIIDTTPAWTPVVEALGNLKGGGRLVINAIRKESKDKEALLALDYPKHLWLEKEIKSVANVARIDISEFLQIAARTRMIPEVQEYPLEDANRALVELKERKIRGAKVLKMHP